MFDGIQKLTQEDEIIALISKRAGSLYRENPNLFYNFMYRLDISEGIIAKFEQDRNFKFLAENIWERQKKKMKNWSSGELK